MIPALEILAKIGFMLAVILGFLPLLIWAERKGSAFIQDRTGPNRANVLGLRLGGLVHPIADVLKLLFKEDFRPAQAHRALYTLAPFIIMTVALTTYAVVPFGDYLEIAGRRIPLVVADLNVGILYVLAIASLGTYGVVMAGWASNNKYSFLGGVRSSAQMISYEI
ncbi:MAG: NADH-quinone oxidoreductase subunit H, partial [Gemmatimonadetes bacterium]|nr:NADH-quinone oxidoreductase subunit H [Gemmatimonadota bacterium]